MLLLSNGSAGILVMPRLFDGTSQAAQGQAQAEASAGAAPRDTGAEEAQLLLAMAEGDRGEPVRELYRRYSGPLYGLGLKLTGDAGLAEELVQETFIRLWRTAPQFDPNRGSARTFIYTIARRLAVDLWRRPSSRPFEPEEKGESAADPEHVIDGMLLSMGVREALDSLPAAHREVLQMTYHGDLSQAEIAARLQVPVGTVKSRTHHALKAFKVAAEQRGIHHG